MKTENKKYGTFISKNLFLTELLKFKDSKIKLKTFLLEKGH